MSAPRSPSLDAADLAGGLVVTALRAGAGAGRIMLRPARVAARVPVAGPRLRRKAAGIAAGLMAEGRAARTQGREQLEVTVADVLAAPEVARTMDRALAGPLTEALGRSVAEHRVAERLATELVESGAVEQALTSALQHEAAQRLLEGALASPGLERLLVAILDSRLVPELTDRILRSPEMQSVLEYVATSPEVRRALTQQSSSLAEEVAGGLRTRTETLDDVAERAVRGWLRRPRPAPQ
jgi:hypothetical protein